MFLPNGITVQSGEAKKQATRHNATAGVAKENGKAMYLDVFKDSFSDLNSPDELFLYAPLAGLEGLRNKWVEELEKKNPSLVGKTYSKPIVTSGITNSLYIISRLFAGKDDYLILPDLYWENYDLLFKIQNETNEVFYPIFDENGFNVKGLDKAIESVKSDKVIVLLNFPNNPTGYSPTVKEADEIVAVLKKHADKGKKVVAISDDAYFGLFYEDNICTESIFAKLCNISENILAIKCDGATKEEMVWGFRTGFITYGCKNASEQDYDVLVKKTLGVIRGCVSNCSMVAQSILLKGMNKPEHDEQKKALLDKLTDHYRAMKKAIENHSDCKSIKALPCNSGYFISFKTKCDADQLRHLLLDEYHTGTIAINKHILRVTFSSVNSDAMEDLISCICDAASKLDE